MTNDFVFSSYKCLYFFFPIVWWNNSFSWTELDEVNQVCDAVGDNFEQPAEDCDEESLQLRQMLKDALAMRVQLSKMDGKIRQKQSDLEKQASYASMLLEEEFDHSFDHYVDYKSMAQYESH